MICLDKVNNILTKYVLPNIFNEMQKNLNRLISSGENTENLLLKMS